MNSKRTEADKGVERHLQGSQDEADQSNSLDNNFLNNITIQYINMTNNHNYTTTDYTLHTETIDTKDTNTNRNHNISPNINNHDSNNYNNFSFNHKNFFLPNIGNTSNYQSSVDRPNRLEDEVGNRLGKLNALSRLDVRQGRITTKTGVKRTHGRAGQMTIEELWTRRKTIRTESPSRSFEHNPEEGAEETSQNWVADDDREAHKEDRKEQNKDCLLYTSDAADE